MNYEAANAAVAGETAAYTATGDPVLDWLRRVPPVVEYRASEAPGKPVTPADDASRTHAEPPSNPAAGRQQRATAVAVEIVHRRHRDHPTWDIPSVPGDLFPLRAAAMFSNGLQHHPICAVVRALRPGESARVRSDHPVGPLCHALEDRCLTKVAWQLEHDGPEEWTLLLTRR